MKTNSLGSLSNERLLQTVATLARERNTQTAILVEHLAEVLRRGLHRLAGYSSLSRYCVGELRFSEWCAHHHAWAAGLARRFPIVLEFLADGRVHLAGLRELGPSLMPDNVAELLTLATYRTRREIQQLLAARVPRPDVPTRFVPIHTSPAARVLTCDEVPAPANVSAKSDDIASKLNGPIESSVPARGVVPVASATTPAPRIEALSPGRYLFSTTLSGETHGLLLRAQELLRHVPECREIEAVLQRALRELVARLERRRFGDTDAPRACAGSDDPRHIPANVRRAVAARDGKRCTYVSAAGVRCTETAFLEYDHITPAARGGRSTPENLRLRCRAHNQLAAEQTFGAGFMDAKREQAGVVREHADQAYEPGVSGMPAWMSEGAAAFAAGLLVQHRQGPRLSPRALSGTS